MKPTPPSANARSGSTPGSGTPLGLVWFGRLVSALRTGRPGQRLCTTAHALLPHMVADAGTLDATEVRAATLARPAIKEILFIAISSPMTLSLSARGRKPCRSSVLVRSLNRIVPLPLYAASGAGEV